MHSPYLLDFLFGDKTLMMMMMCQGVHLASQNLDQSLTGGLAWRACRAGADHPGEHHLPRGTFAAHADDVA